MLAGARCRVVQPTLGVVATALSARDQARRATVGRRQRALALLRQLAGRRLLGAAQAQLPGAALRRVEGPEGAARCRHRRPERRGEQAHGGHRRGGPLFAFGPQCVVSRVATAPRAGQSDLFILLPKFRR